MLLAHDCQITVVPDMAHDKEQWGVRQRDPRSTESEDERALLLTLSRPLWASTPVQQGFRKPAEDFPGKTRLAPQGGGRLQGGTAAVINGFCNVDVVTAGGPGAASREDRPHARTHTAGRLPETSSGLCHRERDIPLLRNRAVRAVACLPPADRRGRAPAPGRQGPGAANRNRSLSPFTNSRGDLQSSS